MVEKEKLTGELVQLVTKHIPQPHSPEDIQAILVAIAMAYAAFADAFHTTEKAQELLIGLAHALGDPQLITTGNA